MLALSLFIVAYTAVLLLLSLMMMLLLLPAAIAEALACALLPGYRKADVDPHERAFAHAASAARLSAVLLGLVEADVQEQLDAAQAYSRSHYTLLLQRNQAPWLKKPWPLDPVDAADGAAAGARSAATTRQLVRQHLRQRFPGLRSRDKRGMCGLEHCPSAMQAAASAAALSWNGRVLDPIVATRWDQKR
jgi:hypothetical protein